MGKFGKDKAAPETAPPLQQEENEQTAVLREIRDELRALRERIDSVVDRVDRGNLLGK